MSYLNKLEIGYIFIRLELFFIIDNEENMVLDRFYENVLFFKGF